jgi:hypothetical protein
MHETTKSILFSLNVAKKKVKLLSTKSAMKGPLFGTIQNPSKAELKQQLLEKLNNKAPTSSPQHKKKLSTH